MKKNPTNINANKKMKVNKKARHLNDDLKNIENIYRFEKSNIKRSNVKRAVIKLEKERVRDHINLMDKRTEQIEFMKNKLMELKKNATEKTTDLKTNINKYQQRKIKEKAHFDVLYKLNEYLKGVGNQVREINVSRGALLTRERKLLKDIKNLFNKNKEEIKYHGLENLTKIMDILDKKTKIISEAQHVLTKDTKNIFADKQVLEKITDKQLNSIYIINSKLRKLNESHLKLLKEKQELKSEEFKFKQMFDEVNKEKKQLLVQLKNV